MSRDEEAALMEKLGSTQFIKKIIDVAANSEHFCKQEVVINTINMTLKQIDKNLEEIKADRRAAKIDADTRHTEVRRDLLANQREVKEDLAEHQREVKTALEKHNSDVTVQIGTLFDGRNKNSSRILRLEVIGATLFAVSTSLWAFFVWVFPKIHLKP